MPASLKRPKPPEEVLEDGAGLGAQTNAAAANTAKKRSKTATSNKGKRGVAANTDSTFEEMVFQLILYKSEHGTCNVPKVYDGHNKLGQWAWEVRNEFLRGGRRAPSADQVKVLRSVGFSLLPASEQIFQDRLRELRAFKQRHGHCMVPTAKCGALGRWVNAQRVAYCAKLKGTKSKSSYMLDQGRIDALNELGFVWRVKEQTSWNDRLEELKAFQAVNGHTVVPQLYEQNKSLGKWVTKQRYCYNLKLQGKKTQLTDERIAALNAIGFGWSARKGRK